MTDSSDITITNTGTAFEATRDGFSYGYLKYSLEPGYIDAYSTQVDPNARGMGIAGKLVQALVNEALEQKLHIRPTCSYVDHWLTKHPDLDLRLRAQ